MNRTDIFGLAASVLFSALATGVPTASMAAMQSADGMAVVEPARETQPVATQGDAADDPAIWFNPDDPTKSLIVATDKEWGLVVYDLSGGQVASTPAGLVNNVDLRADAVIDGRNGVIVAASDRSLGREGRIALYALEASPAGLRHLAHVPVESDGRGLVYGICLWRRSQDEIHAFITYNNGDVRQYALALSGPDYAARLVRDVTFASRTEGCVVDDRTGVLYVGEEDVGVWRLDAAPDSRRAPTLFAAVDGVRIIADVEGLALMQQGASGGYLIVSSQADSTPDADSAYVIYDLESGACVRDFRIGASATVDGTTDTDGIEFAPGDFGGPFVEGLFVVQDGDNSPDNQNFKLVSGSALRSLIEGGTDICGRRPKLQRDDRK